MELICWNFLTCPIKQVQYSVFSRNKMVTKFSWRMTFNLFIAFTISDIAVIRFYWLRLHNSPFPTLCHHLQRKWSTSASQTTSPKPAMLNRRDEKKPLERNNNGVSTSALLFFSLLHLRLCFVEKGQPYISLSLQLHAAIAIFKTAQLFLWLPGEPGNYFTQK